MCRSPSGGFLNIEIIWEDFFVKVLWKDLYMWTCFRRTFKYRKLLTGLLWVKVLWEYFTYRSPLGWLPCMEVRWNRRLFGGFLFREIHSQELFFIEVLWKGFFYRSPLIGLLCVEVLWGGLLCVKVLCEYFYVFSKDSNI